jgi:hypothetical protein
MAVGASVLNGGRQFLQSVAILVEAAGTLDRAAALGLIGGRQSPLMRSGLRNIVPRSRGGTSSDPDAEDKWATLLATALLHQGFDVLDDMRALIKALEAHAEEAGEQAEPALRGELLEVLD